MLKPRRRQSSGAVNNLRRHARKLKDEPFRSGWDEAACSIEPLSNIAVGAEEITVTVDLPLVDDRHVRVQVHGGDTVEVYAKTKRTVRFDDLGIKHRRGEFTCYRALIELPEPVDGARVVHHLKRGILEIRLPKLRQK